MMLRVVIEIKQIPTRRVIFLAPIVVDLLLEGLEVIEDFLCLVKLQLGGSLV